MDTDVDAELMIRDTNGNTLGRMVVQNLPYRSFMVTEAHLSDSGTIVVTVELLELVAFEEQDDTVFVCDFCRHEVQHRGRSRWFHLYVAAAFDCADARGDMGWSPIPVRREEVAT